MSKFIKKKIQNFWLHFYIEEYLRNAIISSLVSIKV